MKKIFVALLATIVSAFASNITTYSGVVKFGVQNMNISASEKRPEPVTIFIEAKNTKGGNCGIFAEAIPSYFTSADIQGRATARVTSINCGGKGYVYAQGWVYDEKGDFGAKSLSAGTKVSVVLKPVVNAINLTAKIQDSMEEIHKAQLADIKAGRGNSCPHKCVKDDETKIN